MKVSILNIQFDNVTMQESLDITVKFLHENSVHMVVTPNAEMMMLADKDAELNHIINHSDLVLPDGSGILWASRYLRKPLKEKCAGIEYAQKLLPVLEREHKSLFLLGGKPGIAEMAAVRIKDQYPSLVISGVHDGFDNENSILKHIKEVKPDVIFVCLGTPKQEFWMKTYGEETGARLLCGLGGSVDILSGLKKRAPNWMIRLQCEWLYRLLKEPKRFRRMIRTLPEFVFHVIFSKKGI